MFDTDSEDELDLPIKSAAEMIYNKDEDDVDSDIEGEEKALISYRIPMKLDMDEGWSEKESLMAQERGSIGQSSDAS